MNDKLFFVSGLPRSGSTLLMNLLGQNPDHHVTPTSGLIELVMCIRNNWKNFTEFKAEGLDVVRPRVSNSMKGIINGYFEEEFNDNKVVFDKSRGWIQYIEILEKILQKEVKIIVTVRDVRAIVASFEKIYRNRDIDYMEGEGPVYLNMQTVNGRAEQLLSDGGVIGLAINRLRDALQRGVANKLIIVPYNHLTSSPKEMMDMLHDGLGLKKFDYDPNNVDQITKENDTWHGMNLHSIKSKIEPPQKLPWVDVLPKDLCEQIDSKYQDISRLCS